MIEKLEINGVHMHVDEKLQTYTLKKIGKLDKFISRHARESVHAEVKLKEGKNEGRSQYTCEVIIYLPQAVITTKETTLNSYAAVDIVEAKLRNQLKEYKDKHLPAKFHRRLLSRWRPKI